MSTDTKKSPTHGTQMNTLAYPSEPDLVKCSSSWCVTVKTLAVTWVVSTIQVPQNKQDSTFSIYSKAWIIVLFFLKKETWLSDLFTVSHTVSRSRRQHRLSPFPLYWWVERRWLTLRNNKIGSWAFFLHRQGILWGSFRLPWKLAVHTMISFSFVPSLCSYS